MGYEFLPQSWREFHPEDGLVVTEYGMAELMHPEQWRDIKYAATGAMGKQFNVHDFKRNTSPGILNGDAAWTRDKGWSLSFDGTGDYVDIGNDASLRMGQNSFTLAMWIKPTSVSSPANFQILLGKDVSGSRDWNFGFGASAQSELSFSSFAGFSGTRSTINAVVTAGEWQHVAVVVIWSQFPEFFFNAVEEADDGTAGAWEPDFTNTNDINIGRREFATFEQYYNGLIDDVRIIKRQLHPGEIKCMYECGRGGMYKVRLLPSIFMVPAAPAAGVSQLVDGGLVDTGLVDGGLVA